MKRRKPSGRLRGSVTQTPTVRMRADTSTRFAFLMRLTALAASVLITLFAVGWLWHIGWPQREAGRMFSAGINATGKAKFAVRDITVEGRQQTSKEALSAALNLSADAPILGFDIGAAEARVAQLPWVASATIERRLPDTIRVHLTERTPMARWQHDNHTIVIDMEGKELPDAKPEDFIDLPLLVGAGVPDAASKLLRILKDYPDIGGKLVAAVRVGERRWDLHLQPKVLVQLPEDNERDAIRQLITLINDKHILDQNIATIDLRDPDRMIFEPANQPNATASTPSASPARPVGDKRL